MFAPEGIPAIGVVLAVAVAALLLADVLWSIPLWIVLAFLLALYYEPPRRIPAAPLAIVSPVDGTVTEVCEVPDDKVQRRALSVAIAIPAPGVRALRSPTEGKVMDLWTRGGPCDDPEEPVRRLGNQACYGVWIQTDEGDDVVCALSTRRLYSRFKSRVAPGERIGQGQRSGFIYFATGIRVLLPPESQSRVAAGDPVLAGSDVIATLVRV